MSSFAVRIAGSNEVVGIFSAPTIAGLRSVVDECTNTEFCEYVRLSAHGGVFVEDDTLAQWPPRFVTDDELNKNDENPFSHAVACEDWLGTIMYGKWKPLGAFEW